MRCSRAAYLVLGQRNVSPGEAILSALGLAVEGQMQRRLIRL